MSETNRRLEGRVAIVTGAASGIGRTTALALAEAGAAVLAADLNRAGAEEVADVIRGSGGQADAQRVDVGEEDSVAEMIGAAVDHFGGLDLLHNNAADSSPEWIGRDTGIAELEMEVWDRAMRINLRGPLLGCKYAIPHLIARGGGVIVNTSSASGLVGDDTRAAYSASKAGLQSLTQSVATQYGKAGIRCNAIAPGVIDTPALAANVPAEVVAAYANNTLTPRLGRAEDIAAAVVFLASEEAAFITGQVLSVDGGLLAHHPAMSDVRALAGQS